MRKYAVRELVPREAEEELRAYPPLLRHLLFHRGIARAAEAEVFLRPDFSLHTHDPFLMADMEKAVSRILRAVRQNERIAIWSDYDVDGISGGIVLHDFFRKIGFDNFENYIPDRTTEGFGLNGGGLRNLRARGATLLITVDCGIGDAAEIALARELGIDVIVTDHHLPNGALPPAAAVIDSKRDDCGYPDKMLCGAGVAFKLVQALLARGGFSAPVGWERWLLDVVGLATLSDMVPLRGENRVFARYGLLVIRKSRRVGLRRLLSSLRLRQSALTEDDIGFSIAPRINAASRMGAPMDAFRLLSTADGFEAERLVAELERVNAGRKGIVAGIVKEARTALARRRGAERHVIVAGNPAWRPALLGLVANALLDEHGKPVFLWGREGGTAIKGSCRSGSEVNLLELMQESRDVFEEFGGHALSGGFTVAFEKVHFLEDELERAYERAKSKWQPAAGAPVFTADRRFSLDDVSEQTARELSALGPFGVGNPKPLFLFEGVTPAAVEHFGREKNHLKLVFARESGGRVSAVSFFGKGEGGELPVPAAGEKIDLLAAFEESSWGSRSELRLRIAALFPNGS